MAFRRLNPRTEAEETEGNPADARVPSGERSQDKGKPDPSNPPISAAACPSTSEWHVKHYNSRLLQM